MNRLEDPAVASVIIPLIGILAGCLVQWVAGNSWLPRQITGAGASMSPARSWVVGPRGSS
jgi:hypothetical protein